MSNSAIVALTIYVGILCLVLSFLRGADDRKTGGREHKERKHKHKATNGDKNEQPRS